MKNQTGIWIDGKKAVVIAFTNGKETIREIESDIEDMSHHLHYEGDKGTFLGTHRHNSEPRIQERKRYQTYKFLDKVIAELDGVDEVFIMGPSVMKKKLQTRIQADKQLQPKLKGIVTTGHPTLNQCVEKVREFYKI